MKLVHFPCVFISYSFFIMNKKLFVPLMLVAVSLSGCGSQTATSPVVKEQASKPAEIVTFADAPEGCPKASRITAKTSDFKETTFTSVSNWFTVWKNTPESAQLVFSTYTVPKDSIYGDHVYTDSDALVVVNFTDTVTKVAGVGNYSGASDAKMKVKDANISSKNLSGGVFDTNGALEISHLDSKYACGTMKFSDGSNVLKGEFIAQVNLMGL